jgi:hypothetical protein
MLHGGDFVPLLFHSWGGKIIFTHKTSGWLDPRFGTEVLDEGNIPEDSDILGCDTPLARKFQTREISLKIQILWDVTLSFGEWQLKKNLGLLDPEDAGITI